MAGLIGRANEVRINGEKLEPQYIQRHKCLSLIHGILNNLVYTIKQLLEIKESSGEWVPYLGSIEVNLQISEFTKYNKDVLMLVRPNTRYGE